MRNLFPFYKSFLELMNTHDFHKIVVFISVATLVSNAVFTPEPTTLYPPQWFYLHHGE